MILLDTNICIYIIKHKPEVVLCHFQQYHPGDIGISSITLAELQYGVAKSQAQKRKSALSRLTSTHCSLRIFFCQKKPPAFPIGCASSVQAAAPKRK